MGIIILMIIHFQVSLRIKDEYLMIYEDEQIDKKYVILIKLIFMKNICEIYNLRLICKFQVNICLLEEYDGKNNKKGF
jgi:hypothetical protein